MNKLSDERLKLTQEALQGIRLLKYYAWENIFRKRIEDIRDAELSRVRRILFLQAISNGLVFWIPIFGGSAIVALHAWRNGTVDFDGSLIYKILIMMNYLGTPIFIIPIFSSSLVAAKAASRRLVEYFEASEAPSHVRVSETVTDAVVLNEAEFMWETLPPSELGSKKKKKMNKHKHQDTTCDTTVRLARLEKLDLSLKKGSFTVVIGEVGSGKSSLLSALIGEMKLINGEASLNVTPDTTSPIAYCPQQAWIMSGTVRDNILFGREYDQKLYNRVIDESCMKSDLEQLPNGDHTELGEGGAGLSGGQKQRLSLARALYSQSSIYLLDDPLSAVDPAVARRILVNCLMKKNGLLKGTTRILVTHQVGLLRDLQGMNQFDSLIVMKRCKINYMGIFNLDATRVKNLKFESPSDSEVSSDEGAVTSTLKIEEDDPTLATTPLPDSEAPGDVVPRKVVLPFTSGQNKFWIYLCSAGLFWSVVVVSSLLAGTEVVKTWKDMFLNTETENMNGSYSADGVIAIYTSLGLLQGTLSCLTCIVYGIVVSYRAGKLIHRESLRSLMRTSISFFDQVQIGAVLERFGSDLMNVDSVLPEKALQVLAVIGAMISAVIMLAVSCWLTGSDTPAQVPSWLAFLTLIGGLLPLGFFIFCCWYIFTGGWSPIQIIIGRAASKVTGVFTESLSGLSTLRTFNATGMFARESANRIDALGRAVLLALAMRRWVSTRIDIATTGVVILTIFLTVWLRLPPKLSGLLMFYSLNIAYLLEWCIKQMAEVESNLNAFDRIAALSRVLDDENNGSGNVIASVTNQDWPRKGSIKIDNLIVRYRADLPPTLKGLSINIEAGQKVAIVGRTGAGKSSLIAAIYRMAYRPDAGSITIDGIDIASVPLDVLRSRLSIVTQDPVLFSGTLRFNLDPEGKYPDAAVWHVLEATRMNSDIASHPLKLDMPVEDGGANFSVGQRQLLCLARALLRNPAPILLVDEATANVDFDTDARIQEALRQHLIDRPGTTMITIAHRISTIIDYDRVAVLGNGHLLEWGNPRELMAQKGHFREMVEKAGIPLPVPQ